LCGSPPCRLSVRCTTHPCRVSLHDALPISSPLCTPPFRVLRRTASMGRERRRLSGHFRIFLACRKRVLWTLPPGIRFPIFMLELDRESTRLNSSHVSISCAVFC